MNEPLHPLFNLSPLDGRYIEQLSDLRPILSEYALFYFRTVIEIRWLDTLLKLPEVNQGKSLSQEAFEFLNKIIDGFSLKDAEHIKAIEKKTNHDVKAVEYFIKEKLTQHSELKHYNEWVHFGCTSEDINNLAYALMLKEAYQSQILPQIKKILVFLQATANKYSQVAMLARTHGQPASPTTVGKEFANLWFRLERQLEQFEKINFLGKFNGAVGNFNAHYITFEGIDWLTLSKNFVESLGLTHNPLTTQIEPHDGLAEFFHCLIRVNTILIDMNRDLWGYISLNYFQQKVVDHEIGSSTMPHKVNPIDFENSEGNLSLANALLSFLSERLPISRWQRDLVDSTLLRNISVALGHSYLGWKACLKGLNKLAVNEAAIANDLSRHPEVLAEAIQTVMRALGVEQAYEQLKALTRGKFLDEQTLLAFIETLELPEPDKAKLRDLKPSNYIGLADKLVKDHL